MVTQLDPFTRPATFDAPVWRRRPVARRARVILAEHDADVRYRIGRMLARDGIEVEEVDRGDAILDRLATHLLEFPDQRPIDLIIADDATPAVTGLDVLAGLRRGSWPIPFILITASSAPDLVREARRLGAAAVFAKPFDVSRFGVFVRRLLWARWGIDLDGDQTARRTRRRDGMS